MNKLFWAILIALISVACADPEIPADVAFLIKKSKKPKPLERILKHYNSPGDSLKYKAAIYLIRNMPGKGCNTGKGIDFLDQFFLLVGEKQQSGGKLSEKEMEVIWDSLYTKAPGKSRFINDLDQMNYKLLKKTIDHSFDVWKNSLYCSHISYDDFLMYILPYRTNTEALAENKTWLADRYSWLQDSMKGSNDPVKACIYINNELRSWFFYFWKLEDYPGSISIDDIYKSKAGVCRDMSNLATVVMRSVGIPVTTDYTTQWANIKSGHSWNVVFDRNMRPIPFMGAEANPGEISHYRETEKAAKVFRKTFKIQKSEIIDYPANIPSQFVFTDYLDVTGEYTNVSDITLDLRNIPDNAKYVYICVFNNTIWNPIYWGKIMNGKVTFYNMGRDVVYLPVYCQNQNYRIAAEPFLLSKEGDIIKYIPGFEVHQTMRLTRKYPLFIRIQRYIDRMKGGRFQGANKQDFSDAVDLDTIENPTPCMTEVSIKSDTYYKYVRYIGPEGGYSDIAEMEFYGNSAIKGKIEKCSGKVIGQGENYMIYNEAMDGNRTSYFYSVKPGKKEWVGLSFKQPQQIRTIRYLARTDDNAVRPGDEYELFFWAQGWISAGTQVATQNYLLYHNIPKNTIYWLRDLTRGKEERIFTYENGQQVWW